jgi:hypothetical protein
MHVLFVTGEYPPMQGGVGAYTREISRALQQGGARISVLTAQRAAQPDCAAFDGSIRVLPAVECWDWRVLSMIPELARALRTDLVHVQYQTAAYAMHLPSILRLAGGSGRASGLPGPTTTCCRCICSPRLAVGSVPG